MEIENELRMIEALEQIASRLDKLVSIIEDEKLYVTGDINVID